MKTTNLIRVIAQDKTLTYPRPSGVASPRWALAVAAIRDPGNSSFSARARFC